MSEMVYVPLIAFWILIFVGRNELEWKGMFIAVAIWAALGLGFKMIGLNEYYFIVAQAIMDCILIIIIFGGDVRIR